MEIICLYLPVLIAIIGISLENYRKRKEEKQRKKLEELRRQNLPPAYKVKVFRWDGVSTTVFESADLSSAIRYAGERFTLQQILEKEVIVCESLGEIDLDPIPPERYLSIFK